MCLLLSGVATLVGFRRGFPSFLEGRIDPYIRAYSERVWQVLLTSFNAFSGEFSDRPRTGFLDLMNLGFFKNP